MGSALFQEIKLRKLALQNRLVVSPMCTYEANAQGLANDFHLAHYGSFALGGAGLIIQEATAVHAAGRISDHDLGLWNDEQIGPLAHITAFIHRFGGKVAVQLAHAGRKASTHRPSEGQGALSAERGGWQTIAPSAIAFAPHYPQPREMTAEDIAALPEAFAAAARRALVAGYDAVEVHAAHGYLLHQFLSPLSNARDDEYGGSFENRIRLTLEVAQAVRRVWPEDLPLLVRISATDWVEGGWNVQESAELVGRLSSLGVDVVDVSSGGLSTEQRIEVRPLYQLPFARHLKEQRPEMLVMAVGQIDTAEAAEGILQDKQADLIAMGRPFLRDPHLGHRFAVQLGEAPTLPTPHARANWVK